MDVLPDKSNKLLEGDLSGVLMSSKIMGVVSNSGTEPLEDSEFALMSRLVPKTFLAKWPLSVHCVLSLSCL